MRIVNIDAVIARLRQMSKEIEIKNKIEKNFVETYNNILLKTQIDTIIKDIFDFSSPWVLVINELDYPPAQEPVLVSCLDDSGDIPFSYTSTGWVTPNHEYWIVDNEINRDVVAWMPLPEPYGEY